MREFVVLRVESFCKYWLKITKLEKIIYQLQTISTKEHYDSHEERIYAPEKKVESS